MPRRHAFTLIELLVVISIIALLIGILLPALSSARITAQQLASNTQLRGIHQGMVVFAQENKSGGNDGYFPGLSPEGDLAEVPTPGVDTYWLGGGQPTRSYGSPKHRYSLLLNGNYITPEYAASPVDADVVVASGGAMNSDHFSYGMNTLGAATWGYFSVNTALDATSLGRVLEWSETLNTSAPVMGDINTGQQALVNATESSWWTQENSGKWEGGITYNDNSVSFESSVVVANSQFSTYPAVSEDHIFRGDDSADRANAQFVLGRVDRGNNQEQNSFRR